MQAKGMKPIAIEFGSSARLLGDIPQDYIPAGDMGGTNPTAGLSLAQRELGLKKVNEVYLITDGAYHTEAFDNYCQSFCDDVEVVFVGRDGNTHDSYSSFREYGAETKKQSRPVKPTANPQGVRFTYGTPIDLASLGEKLTIGNRLAAGKFKLEAHYPAKQFNNKTEYINKRKEGSYCRFYDNKSPYFIARTVWDADRMPGIHMKAKNKFGETYTFVVTPKLDDPTKVTILGGYVIPTVDGPVLCTGAIGELEAVGDDGDFKVVAYDKPNIRCPKSATGKVPTSMAYVKRPSKPRKTAADYCKPKHSFKHPTDIRAAEMVGEMADWIDEGTECYSCGWEGTIGELEIETDPEDATMPIMICPLCGEDEWLSDLFEAEAGEYDEPCFSCDGMGADTEGKCGYCGGSGMMSETLKADLAAFDSEYFDAECGCWKGLESEDEPTCASCGEVVKEDDIIGDGTNRGLCCVPDYYDDEDEEYYGEMYEAELSEDLEFQNHPVHVRIFDVGADLDGKALSDDEERRLVEKHQQRLFGKIGEEIDDIQEVAATFTEGGKEGTIVGSVENETTEDYDAEAVNSREAARRARRQKLKESSPTLTVTKVEPDDKIPTMNRITFENGLVAGYSKNKNAKVGDKFVVATFDGRFPTILDAETRVTIEHEDDFDIYKGFSVYDENDNEGVVISMNAEAKKELSFMDWAKQEEASHLKKYGADGHDECQDSHLDGIDFVEWSEEAEGPDCYITGLPNPDGDIEGEDNICEACSSKWIYDEDGPEGEGYYRAKVLEAPLVGAGATMDIAKDTDLGSFTSKELTESSAISGDFDHASLNYSGNQNIAARAEGTSSMGLLKSIVGGIVTCGAFAAGMYSAKKIIEIGDDE